MILFITQSNYCRLIGTLVSAHVFTKRCKSSDHLLSYRVIGAECAMAGGERPTFTGLFLHQPLISAASRRQVRMGGGIGIEANPLCDYNGGYLIIR